MITKDPSYYNVYKAECSNGFVLFRSTLICGDAFRRANELFPRGCSSFDLESVRQKLSRNGIEVYHFQTDRESGLVWKTKK